MVGKKASQSVVSKASSQPVKLFPPYAPPKDAEHNDELQFTLHTYLKTQLSALLRLQFLSFWSTVLYPIHPSHSVATFLDAYFRHTPLDPELAQKVFFLICRLGLAPAEAESLMEREAEDDDEASETRSSIPPEALEWASHDWADAVYDLGILSLPSLLDIAHVFADSNPSILRQVFQCIWKAQPKLSPDLRHTLKLIVRSVHDVQKKYGKLGKGKGKGKSSEADSSSSVSFSDGNNADRVKVEAEFLYRAMSDLRGAVQFGGEDVASILLEGKEIVRAMADIYQVANIWMAIEALDDDWDASRSTVNDIREPETILRSPCNDHRAQARRVKAAVLLLIETILQVFIGSPLKLASEKDADSDSDSTPAMADVIAKAEVLCDTCMELLEASHFEGPVPFLESAPILVDLEVDFGLGEWIKQLQDRYLKDEGDARLDYLIASLEQLLMFSGNAETKRVLANQRAQRRQQEALLSDLSGTMDTVNADAGSSSTIDMAAMNEEYIKRTSLISQVQDLFPELGEGFIEACLLAFGDDAEIVIMKILEGDLPEYVSKLDRNMQRTAPVAPPPATASPPKTLPAASIDVDVDFFDSAAPLPPSDDQPSLLSNRRNVYDGDEFDVFARGKVDMDKVHFGKKNDRGNVLDDKSFVNDAREKLLAVQYDEYDDEYDDTYDDNDIKLAGTIEAPTPDAPITTTAAPIHVPDDPIAPHEPALMAVYMSTPDVFDRANRKGATRVRLREETGLSDQQIEGWGSMLRRNPRKDKLLAKYEWRGNRALPQNANHTNNNNDDDDDDEEASDAESDDNDGGGTPGTASPRGGTRGGRGGGQSRGGGGGGRGGRGGGGRGGSAGGSGSESPGGGGERGGRGRGGRGGGERGGRGGRGGNGKPYRNRENVHKARTWTNQQD
ncbi:uncharacterized protein EV422DRAFT_531529 [Fimicolochytrium jonesii]|uniref:uncharacterized protein n=1 Tax=Fimicolochytrium jonesii TaxID=1396493 RepID=UPI0022FF3F5D|nr:uncharacterized protein EV422DRAFT_531529 [Fimicolochytrium jonesii]KAI8820082.1 hypothetical protein EV422DRAFT_531529 [Fimicolochytrium jonesii]